jgi:carboxymethylenebutenolidase
MGDHLAAHGYVVVVPDVYYRVGGYEPFAIDTVFSDPVERQRLMDLARTLTPAMFVRDARALVDALATRTDVAPGPVGTVGYCMGGRTSLIVAGHLGDRIGAAASIHGGGLAVHDDPDSPHHRAAQISAEVYVGAASDDASFDADQEDTLRRALGTAGVHYRLDTYPARHGFAVPDNPTHDEPAAETHWKALTELFATALVR